MTEQSDIHKYSIFNRQFRLVRVPYCRTAFYNMVYSISNKELTRESRKTIIAGLRQMAGEIIHGHPKIHHRNFRVVRIDPPCGQSEKNILTIT